MLAKLLVELGKEWGKDKFIFIFNKTVSDLLILRRVSKELVIFRKVKKVAFTSV